MSNNIFTLKDKVIVITGAAGFLGRMHAEAVASNGGLPILLDINVSGLKDLTDFLKDKYHANAEFAEVDITDEIAVRNAADNISENFFRIDGLINNAANNPTMNSSDKNISRLESFPLDQWNNDINVGLTGAFLCSKYFGQKIADNENGGSIINISSDLGLIAPDQNLYKDKDKSREEQNVKPVTYSVVKTGIIGLTRYLATYWPENGVRCNALCPGGVENNQSNDFINRISKKIPLGRMARSDEFQGTIIWMLSDASSYLNGAVITVDGGRTVW
ncbi:SDR family oxidoreductase [SAR86 cluster bacterium]|nr:SDR family oxidoreductase [SAR86 cluster bacterium]